MESSSSSSSSRLWRLLLLQLLLLMVKPSFANNATEETTTVATTTTTVATTTTTPTTTPAPVTPGAACSGGLTCVENATCNDGICVCKASHYPDSDSGTCKPRILPSATCDGGEQQCVQNASCQAADDGESRCVCDSSHYQQADQCKQRILPSATCDGGEQQCVQNASCQAADDGESRCVCDSSHYQQADQCKQRIIPSATCDGGEQHCVQNTSCQVADDGESRCVCDSSHYQQADQCKQRILPSATCDGGEQQCVQNASCQAADDGESRCVCDSSHYQQADQCKQRILPSATCDGGEQQCVQNASCQAADDGESRCVCDSSHYQQADQCKQKLGLMEACSTNQCQNGLECNDKNNEWKCRIPAGSVGCSNDNHCVQGASCDTATSTCKLELGEGCSTSNDLCKSGYLCNNRGGVPKCRIPAGSGICSTDDHCIQGSSCESTTSLCKLELGESCFTTNDQCKSGLQCNNRGSGAKCRIPAGTGGCASNDDCVLGASCDISTSTCKLIQGETCSTADDKCGTGLQCSPRNGLQKCRITVSSGISCTTPTPSDDNCVQGATCDSGYCKIEVGESCAGNIGYCVTSATCGAGNICRIPAGSTLTCSSNGDCVLGANCQTSSYTCRIPAGGSLPCSSDVQCVQGAICQSGLCKIPAGSVGCSFDGDCVQSATCKSGTCKYGLGVTCTTLSQCETALTCANRNSLLKCRIPVPSAESCSVNDDCVEGANCDSTSCKLAVEESCSTNADYCVSTAQCDSIANKCKIRVGLSCSGATGSCVTNALCDTQSGYLCKFNYGTTCSAGQCASQLECRSLANGASRCLCESGRYRYNSNCYPVSYLAVSGIQRSGQPLETELTATWSAPTSVDSGSQLSYSAAITPDDSTAAATVLGTTATFRNRTPGTKYTVSIYASVTSDPTYDGNTKAQGGAVTGDIYTKPAQPGELVSDIHMAPNVTLNFLPSAGSVEQYAVTVSNTNLGFYQPTQVTGTQASFTGLSAGKYYDVQIVAFSGSLASDIRQTQFFVDFQRAGKVQELSVYSSGSRWAKVQWKKPSLPNGDIQGYTVEVLLDNQCVSGVAILCSDCSYNVTTTPTVQNCTSGREESSTKAALADPTASWSTNVTSLKPDVVYTVRVRAYNQLGMGQSSDTQLHTDEEAAMALQRLEVTASADNELTVTLYPGERTGNTFYTVTWRERLSLSSSDFEKDGKSVILTGYDNTTYVIRGLLSFWNYSVTVLPYTGLGLADETVGKARTLPTQPGLVSSFTLDQPAGTAQRLTLTAVCPEDRSRNAPIASLSYTSVVTVPGAQASQNPPSGDIPVTEENCAGTMDIPVVAETTYIFSIFAKSEGFEGLKRTKNITVRAIAPLLASRGDGSALVETGGAASTESVPVDLCRCMLSDQDGDIVEAGITVCVKSATETCQPATTPTTVSFYEQQLSWKQFKKPGNKGAGRYRTTPDNFHQTLLASGARKRRFARAVQESVTYTVGANKTCEQEDESVYCNGPLSSGKEYVIIIWACTAAGCSELPDGLVIKTRLPDEDEDSLPAIIGAVVGVLLVIAIVIVVVIFIRKRRSSLPKRKSLEDDNLDNMDTQEAKSVRTPVKLRDFSGHLDKLHRDSNLLFLDEFEEIKSNSPTGYSQEASLLDANKVKNRYVNILPYDRTRVKLVADEDDESEDFINANYIPGYNSSREYIATQGPMTSTVKDFWRMMWEQKSTLIVMLSDLQEKGRLKVDQYWPREINSPIQYGDIVVEMKSESTLNKYTIRIFDIYPENQRESKRQVKQFFIPGWEDYSANLKPDDVIEFVRTIRVEATSIIGPITVHCSAGVGRTGTFIALDYLLQYVRNHSLDDKVDIYSLVLNMRHNRPYMVQSETQYIYIHDALNLIIHKKIEEMQKKDEDNIYQNTAIQDHIYDNQAYEPEENLYENTTSYTPTSSL